MSQQILESQVEVLSASIQVVIAENRELKGEIKRLTSVVMATITETVVTHSEYAERHGISRTLLYSKPWLFPNFGVGDFPGGRRAWKLSTVLSWEKASTKEHECNWLAMPRKKRESIMCNGTRKAG